MASVLPEMHHDALSPGKFRQRRRRHRIRLARPTCLPQGGHMIDIDGNSSHGSSFWLVMSDEEQAMSHSLIAFLQIY
jgi:hypothetical protein